MDKGRILNRVLTMNCLPRTDFIQNYITANNLDRCREISSDCAKMNLSAYVRTLEFIFARKCIGKPYIKDRLACCFVNYKDENCARYGQFMTFRRCAYFAHQIFYITAFIGLEGKYGIRTWS